MCDRHNRCDARKKHSQGIVYSFFLRGAISRRRDHDARARISHAPNDVDGEGFFPSEKSGANPLKMGKRSLSGDTMNKGGFTLNRTICVSRLLLDVEIKETDTTCSFQYLYLLLSRLRSRNHLFPSHSYSSSNKFKDECF